MGSVMKRVTITTLAEELGVSICTINKALSGKPKVSAATRERVMAAAARHGYRPNRLAQALVRPVRRVVVLCPDDWPSHYGLILRGAMAAFGRLSDYRITAERQACGRISDDAQFLAVLGQVLADRPDALLLVPGVYRPETLERARTALTAAAVTTILVGIETPGLPYLTGVWHDSARCGRLAAELLAFRGAVPARPRPFWSAPAILPITGRKSRPSSRRPPLSACQWRRWRKPTMTSLPVILSPPPCCGIIRILAVSTSVRKTLPGPVSIWRNRGTPAAFGWLAPAFRRRPWPIWTAVSCTPACTRTNTARAWRPSSSFMAVSTGSRRRPPPC